MPENELWQDLQECGEETIQELCAQGRPEGQSLEFKEKSNSAKPDLSNEDKKNLGKSLSAFSNAVGGLLLWGVRTNTSSGDTEASAKEPQPISNVELFADRLRGLIAEYLSPPNPNIEIHVIRSKADNAQGYVAISVGTSHERPHMSNAPGHHRYYLRSGGSTFPMADFQVRDMLRIRTSPRLSLEARFVARSRSGAGVLSVELVLNLSNFGRVSARDPYVSFLPSERPNPRPGHPFALRLARHRLVIAAENWSLHPGLDVDAAMLPFEAAMKDGIEPTCWFTKGGKKFTSLDTPVEIGCEHLAREAMLIQIPASRLLPSVEELIDGRPEVDLGVDTVTRLVG